MGLWRAYNPGEGGGGAWGRGAYKRGGGGGGGWVRGAEKGVWGRGGLAYKRRSTVILLF